MAYVLETLTGQHNGLRVAVRWIGNFILDLTFIPTFFFAI